MIGVYGGTFDPVHFGHLRTALEVCEFFSLDELRLIPCSRPPHRDAPMASADMRVQMLRLAISKESDFVVDTREITREGPSYMVDTLESIRAEVADEPLLLIIGADGFKHLSSWFQWERLFDFAHIVVMSRPDELNYSATEDDFFSSRCSASVVDLENSPCGALFFKDVTPLAISATQIRQLIASNKNPGFLLPDQIIEFIRVNKLYKEQS